MVYLIILTCSWADKELSIGHYTDYTKAVAMYKAQKAYVMPSCSLEMQTINTEVTNEE